MMTTLRDLTPTNSGADGALPTTLADPCKDCVQPLDVIILESCHSTWIFDPCQLKFCRILKGIEVGSRSVATEWRSYWQVQPDIETDGFTVYLNEARTRLIRSWRHTENCEVCGGYETTELSLDQIRWTLDGHPPRVL
jgi:hypothetical protein